MKTILIHLQLLEPVLVPSIFSDPNSVESLDYAPGGTLQGAIIGRHILQHCNKTTDFDASDSRIRRMFFDGSTRFLNMYPTKANPIEEGHLRLIPTPLSLRKDKQEAAVA